MKVMNGLVMTLEEDKIFLCVWLLYYVSNFADSRLRCQDIDQVLLHEIIFFSQCIQQQWSVSQNYLSSIRSKLPTAACRSWEKREETVKPTCSMSKATSVPQTPQTNHSQCSSPVEALNLILESKSQPVELDSLTIELHVPSRRKKSLQSCCSVDFDFLPLMRFDMTFDIALRDNSSFSNLTNFCN